MRKSIKLTYERALELALPYFSDFYDRHEASRESYSKMDYWQRKALDEELSRYANGCCCACEMVCELFGASDERVHEDLMALRAGMAVKHAV